MQKSTDMEKKNTELNLAVLIDADNVPYSRIGEMMEEITKYGIPTTKRIYGDWTRPGIAGWKPFLLKYAITPIQQYGYTTGKNSTDSAMIIDAMDILYSEKVDGFCIVSSDSDFTRLATRLRESGMKVIGLGEKKTPEPFIVACDKFIFIEILSSEENQSDGTITKSAQKTRNQNVDKAARRLIKATINDLADDDGWAFLGDVGNAVIKKRPEFDPRNYGFNKFTPMLAHMKNDFEIDMRSLANSNIKLVYVRNKK